MGVGDEKRIQRPCYRGAIMAFVAVGKMAQDVF